MKSPGLSDFLLCRGQQYFLGLNIPFPWLPFLKFDFTGIPIVLSLLLYGLPHGATTSIVAFLAILVRSGDFVGSSMKGLAEFFTILGMVVGLRWLGKFRRATSFVIGIIFRCISMSIANLIAIPTYYGMSLAATLSILPLIVVFNAMQGCLSILVGYSIYEALRRRVPSLTKP